MCVPSMIMCAFLPLCIDLCAPVFACICVCVCYDQTGIGWRVTRYSTTGTHPSLLSGSVVRIAHPETKSAIAVCKEAELRLGGGYSRSSSVFGGRSVSEQIAHAHTVTRSYAHVGAHTFLHTHTCSCAHTHTHAHTFAHTFALRYT